MAEKTSYKDIFKFTFLFSFVKIFQILLGVIRNKVVAVLLGVEGVGIIGILSNSIQLLQTGAGLGIPQSAVRDIADANGKGDKKGFSKIIVVTNKVIRFTFLLGCIVTIILSPFLSKWTFGNYSYTVAYLWLSLVVGLNILSEGQLAILKGMRQLKAVAKASVIGSLIGLILGAPLYYFFNNEGIVPAFIIGSVFSVVFSTYFVRKIGYDRVKVNKDELVKASSPMFKMGVALMLVGFLHLLFDLVVVAYVRSKGGLEIVGIYRAGTIIITSYFGVVLSSMTTDYYPRISSVYQNNELLKTELNRQAMVGLTLIFPIAILFVFLSPLLIRLLYSADFGSTVNYTDYAILGTILVVCSDSLGMILLAKQTAILFTIHAFLHRLLFIPVYIFLYIHYGLVGLGVAYAINVLFQFIFYLFVNQYLYKIKLTKQTFVLLGIVLLTVFVTVMTRKIDIVFLRYLAGTVLFLFSLLYAYNLLRKEMRINLKEMLKNRFPDKKNN